MWYAALIRFFRRRLVLGIVFASSLTYCVVNLLKDDNNQKSSYEQDIIIEKKHPFRWRSLQDYNDTLDNFKCRNSIQGLTLIVDERGFLCKRASVLKNSCCDILAEGTSRYSCSSCKSNQCCEIYEHCVSCCLDPSKKDMLQIVLNKLISESSLLFKSVSDHYELCLAKCRTNSGSVQHENSYKDSDAKYCYGELPPGTERTVDDY